MLPGLKEKITGGIQTIKVFFSGKKINGMGSLDIFDEILNKAIRTPDKPPESNQSVFVHVKSRPASKYTVYPDKTKTFTGNSLEIIDIPIIPEIQSLKIFETFSKHPSLKIELESSDEVKWAPISNASKKTTEDTTVPYTNNQTHQVT